MSEESKINYCHFCGNSKEIVKKLVVSEKVAICNECVELCQNLINDEVEPENPIEPNRDPEAIKEYLDMHVVGQEDAKMILSVAIANHYKRINNPPKDIEIQKNKFNYNNMSEEEFINNIKLTIVPIYN
jgi:ATP-dependent Clp protease ATP-binding subunit ClpX